VLGAPGAGKTTLLHRLATEMEADDLGLVPRSVDLAPAATAAQALGLILEALGQRDFSQAWADTLRRGLKPPSTPSSELIGLVRRLGQAPPSLVLADSPPGDGQSHVLFGRLRDELWQLEHRWVVAVPRVQRDEVTRPPANAFFDVRVELGPLPEEARRELLERRLGEEDHVDVEALAQASDGLPRSLIESAREAVLSETSTAEVIAGQDELQARLSVFPEVARDVYAFLRANGPASASDRELLGAMGFSAQRARVVLSDLERAGMVQSFAERQERRGRPRKLYEAVVAP
jgi:MoxR-like ATPase